MAKRIEAPAEQPEYAGLPKGWPRPEVRAPKRKPSRSEILQELGESRRAKAALAETEAKAAKVPEHLEALAEWDRPFNERKQACLERARAAKAKVDQQGQELARHMAAALESPVFRVARSLALLAAAHDEVVDACQAVVAVDFDKALQAHAEDGSPAGLARAKAFAASEAGPSKVAQLVEDIDPGFSLVRSLPAAGPSREVASIIARWLWPSEKAPLDSGKHM